MMSLYLVIYLQNGKEKMQKVLACDRDRAKEREKSAGTRRI